MCLFVVSDCLLIHLMDNRLILGCFRVFSHFIKYDPFKDLRLAPIFIKEKACVARRGQRRALSWCPMWNNLRDTLLAVRFLKARLWCR